jgi:hypothetical protein
MAHYIVRKAAGVALQAVKLYAHCAGGNSHVGGYLRKRVFSYTKAVLLLGVNAHASCFEVSTRAAGNC